MMYETPAIILAVVAILAYGIDSLFGHFDDPREPRRIAPLIRVPVIGHILGVLRYGFNYYGLLSQKTNVEIYALGVLNFKVYIARGDRLRHLVQKSKTLSFTPFLKVPSDVVSRDAHDLFDGALLESFSLRTKEALSPGPHLDMQNLRMGQQLLTHVNDMVLEGEINLFSWAKHAIVQATGAGLYGAKHPFRDCEVEKALWVWEEHRPGQMLGIDPLYRGYRARAKVFEAFRQYFQQIPDDASFFIRQRQKILRDGGIPEEDIYKMQATLSNAAFPNTVPTLFWTIFEIYTRPDLLEDIRRELYEKAVNHFDDGAGFVLNIAALQTECTLLLSAYQETQRTRHSQVAWRMVTEDTVFDQYILKKGNYLQMPVRSTHESHEIWGPQAHVFNPYRFTPPTQGNAKSRIVPSSFLAWGSPPHLCPARQFASTEILIAAALMILRVQLTPVNSQGWGKEPAVRSGTPTLPRPKEDIRVRVTPRITGKKKWNVVIGTSKARISLASG
ncbi:cytochrome P450 [Xylariaceae sp. FL0016]|nr:cytochrome P450 [Xylariaceae sp. FL0016]